MRVFILLIAVLVFVSGCEPEPGKRKDIGIIPIPQKIDLGDGYFTFKEVYLEMSTSLLKEVIIQSFGEYGITFNSSKKGEKSITISVLNQSDTLGQTYYLSVLENEITIKAGNEQSAFYAIQTLLQSLENQDSQWVIPEMKVTDYPQFQHRGLLLDCSRHFFSVEVVKKYIDLLSYYKMNVLHWHLTEDQGWRIEIDQYPKLTEVGAWRTEEDGSIYGGFYTKDEIREIVTYANDRFVTIIPEIELPGHSQAALAAYPEFSCLGDGIEVVNDWGVFKEIYCAGNDETFVFLENVLSEVMELFPSEYIHIGGDEAPKYRWEHCDKCQRRIKEEGLHDEHELQSYFISRIESFLNANGRKLIGWDEIMEGGLSPNATVQSWRGMEYGRDAAREQHQVILSPTSHAYLDYNLKSIDLKKVYSFDPIPHDLEEEYHKNVLGAEVNMWTEHVPDEKTLDQKVFPRLLAMAEVTWRYDENRNFDEFYNRVQQQYPILEKKGVQYGLEGKSVNISSDDNFKVELFPGVPELDLFYSKDGLNFLPYKEVIPIDFSGNIVAMAKKNGEQYGDTVVQEVTNHEGIGKAIDHKSAYNNSYSAGGKFALLDGLIASEDFRDGRWQGYYGDHVTCTIDLGEVHSIQSVFSNFYQYNNAWIFLPTNVSVALSIDGKNWKIFEGSLPQLTAMERGKFVEKLGVEFDHVMEAQFIKFMAKNQLVVPDWHEAAGSKAWLFLDEIVIK